MTDAVCVTPCGPSLGLARNLDRADSADAPGGAGSRGPGIPLIEVVLSGALRIHPPEGGRATEPARDD